MQNLSTLLLHCWCKNGKANEYYWFQKYPTHHCHVERKVMVSTWQWWVGYLPLSRWKESHGFPHQLLNNAMDVTTWRMQKRISTQTSAFVRIAIKLFNFIQSNIPRNKFFWFNSSNLHFSFALVGMTTLCICHWDLMRPLSRKISPMTLMWHWAPSFIQRNVSLSSMLLTNTVAVVSYRKRNEQFTLSSPFSVFCAVQFFEMIYHSKNIYLL